MNSTGETPASAQPLVPAPKPRAEEGGAGTRMSFMDHLMEFRRRLMAAVFAIAITTVLTLIFYEPVFAFLMRPVDDVNRAFRKDLELNRMLLLCRLDPELRRKLDAAGLTPQVRTKVLDALVDPDLLPTLDVLIQDPELLRLLRKARPDAESPVVHPISTGPLATMLMLMKVAVWAGLVLSSPFVLYQIWAFVAPGLKPNEVRAIRPVLFGGLLFFIAGASFCYYVVFPYTILFLVWLDVHLGFQPSYTPEDYIGLLITFMLTFGAVFELPLVVAVLARLRLVKPAWLSKYWRMIVLVCFVLGALLSPGTDIMSMVLLSGTLVFLYALSVVLAYLLYPKEKAL